MQDELLKVTLNLFADDVEFFKDRFGPGWSVEIRRLVHREVQGYQELDNFIDHQRERT